MCLTYYMIQEGRANRERWYERQININIVLYVRTFKVPPKMYYNKIQFLPMRLLTKTSFNFTWYLFYKLYYFAVLLKTRILVLMDNILKAAKKKLLFLLTSFRVLLLLFCRTLIHTSWEKTKKWKSRRSR